MTRSTKIALTAILLFLHLSLRPILVSFQGVTYLYFKNPDVADFSPLSFAFECCKSK